MEVYIVMSRANKYDQPEAAFEKLFWEKPTEEELIEFGLTLDNMYDGCVNSGYWVVVFQSPDHYEDYFNL